MAETVLCKTRPTNDAIARLWAALDAHVKLRAPVPARTAHPVTAGEPKMAQNVVEEAGEVAVAAMMKDRTEVVRESAELIYHMTILWAQLGVRPEEIWAEMAVRKGTYGLAEKRAKARHKLLRTPPHSELSKCPPSTASTAPVM